MRTPPGWSEAKPKAPAGRPLAGVNGRLRLTEHLRAGGPLLDTLWRGR